MERFIKFSLLIFALSIAFGCGKEESAHLAVNQKINPEPSNTPNIIPKIVSRIDVPRLAGKSAEELDKIIGKPEKITPATARKEIPGEYRLYKIEGNPKGLSVRFYKDKAVRFNLILEKPFASAKDALLETFTIDVKNIPPTVDKAEPLSQKWQGEFGGVRFATVYAKKDTPNGQFVMVHAEIVQ